MRALFLDRDGVLNFENLGGYILSIDAFELMPGVTNAMRMLREHFDLFIVVTNQRCVGRGLITVQALEEMQRHMTELIAREGGHIDRIYYAPALDSDDHFRKPNIGMGEQALKDFPHIELDRSYIVGNNLSDMQFGKSLGLKTVFVTSTSPPYELPHDLIDLQFDSLLSFAESL